MTNVFLSYARADAQTVERVARDLRSQGVEVWIDKQDLVAGEEWVPQIKKALLLADFVVFFISKASLNSKWVQEEYRAAFNALAGGSGGRPLIPVLLEPVELPPFLSSIQYVDLTESYFEGIQQLLRALKTPVGPRPSEVLDATKLAREVAGEVAKILGLESQRKPATAVQETDPDLVFVIIAFRDDMEPIFEGIRDAGESLGLTVKRVKDVQGDFRITDKVIQMINSARLVVADLSHERPNVYFELGYARGLGKTVITIARESTSIHFDVKDWTYISYIDSRTLERDLKKRFEYELAQSHARSEGA